MGELYNPFPKLPKNIRQIGERDQTVRLYVEDYVNTYLKRLYPRGGQDLRVGVLLGNVEEHEGTPYLFVDGAMEMEDVTENGEKVIFSETAWKKIYQNMEQVFPKRVILGWFLCGVQGTQLSPLNYWKQHGQYFAGKNQLMYLNSGLEGEEAIYITSEDGFYKLRGHSIYYERNQMMQDYMILRKDVRRVETGAGDPVIRDFRQRMEESKRQVTARRSTVSVLGGVCTALSVVVLAGGVVMFNNYEKMKQMESVIASVMPSGEKMLEGKDDDELVIEEAAGKVYPTTAPQDVMGETADESTQAPGKLIIETLPPAPTAAQAEAPAETTGPAAEAAANQTTYVIQDGETLYGICLKFYDNLDRLEEVCNLNGLTDENKIISGQKLILPN